MPPRSTSISRRTFLRWSAAGAAAAGPLGRAAPAEQGRAPGPRPAAVQAYGYDHDAPPLDPGPHLFFDWRYVYPGQVRWLGPDGQKVRLDGEGLPADVRADAIRAAPGSVPYGIRLEAQPAARVGPVLHKDRPWERSVGYVTLLHTDGKYRLYYETAPPGGVAEVLCYAESADGVAWTKPRLGLVEYGGGKDNNIVFGGPLCPEGFHGVSVFPDPHAPAAERFKMISMAKASPEAIARLKRERPESVSTIGEGKRTVIRLAVSPDGLHWRALDDLLLCHMSDTQTTAYYDAALGRYVAYFRMVCASRRVIGRSETADPRHWPAPEMVLGPDPADGPSADVYTNGKCVYPGTRTAHLMFPTIYRRQVDSTAIRIATSMEGQLWNWLPGGAVLEPGPEGSWDGGCLFAGCGLVELPGGRVGLPYVGSHVPHKFPRFMPLGEYGLATWPRERLAGLVADEEGEFWTPPLNLPAGALYLNVSTRRGGWVRVGVEKAKGRRLEDCDQIVGDHAKVRVTWKGESSPTPRPGRSVQLHFQLRAAKLFSFEVRPA